MKFIHAIFMCLTIGLIMPHYLNAQETPEDPLIIGEKVPDFVLKDVKYYSQKQLTNKDLEGKWVILDFFSKNCSSCFASFPKTNALAQEFKDKVEIILVGSTKYGADGIIQKMYEKYRKHENLKLPVAYASAIFDRWKIRVVPTTIWINDKGIVKVVTTSSLTRENIQSFLNGEDFQFSNSTPEGRSKILSSYNDRKPLLVDGNGATESDLLYRSMLINWNPKMMQSVPESITTWLNRNINLGAGRFDITGVNLEWLYEFAYFDETIEWGGSFYGKIYQIPILKVKDSSLFDTNITTGENFFSYSVSVPLEKATPEFIMKIMQKDLSIYFGYEASIEKQKVPYWSLTVEDKWREKLRTKEDSTIRYIDHAGGTFTNTEMKWIIRKISGYRQKAPPIIDETGIDYNIDLKLNAIMTDFEDVRRALKKSGLHLEKGEKMMPALVIRDPKEKSLSLKRNSIDQ